MNEAFKEAIEEARKLGTPEALVMASFYDGFTGGEEELQASVDEFMGISMSLQYVAYTGKRYAKD